MSTPKEEKKKEQSEVSRFEDEKRALTVRMGNTLFEKIEEVAEELGQKPAAIARNYLNLSPYIFIKSNLEITTRDNNPLILFPASIFELIMDTLRTQPEEKQKEIGDKLGSLININADILRMVTLKQKLELIKTLGWFQYLYSDHLRIPRSFAPPFVVVALLYRMETKKKISTEWTFQNLVAENLNDPKYEKKENKGTKANIDRIRKEFEDRYAPIGNVFGEGLAYDFYEFDKVKLA